MKINNNKELWSEWMGGEETEETSKANLKGGYSKVLNVDAYLVPMRKELW